MTPRIQRWGLLGLTALAFVIRVSGLTFQSLWRDEVDAIRFASQPLPELWRTFASPGQNGPLYFLVLRPWLALAGDGEFALRFLSVLFGVLAVPMVAVLAGRLYPRQRAIALVAALLAATCPYLVWYSQEGKMYAAVVVAGLFSMERLVAATRQGGWWRWLGYVVATTVAVALHLVAALLVPAHVAVFTLLGGWRKRAAWVGLAASLAVLAVPYLPVLAWQIPLLLEPGSTGYAFVPLPQMVGSLLTGAVLGVVGVQAWWMLLPAALLVMAGLVLGPKDGVRPAGVLLSWVVVPVAGLFVISLSRPLYSARYLIFVLPALLLLAAVGARAAARRSPVLAGLLLAALLVVQGRGIWQQARTPLKADFRAATGYIREKLAPGDLVLFHIPYGRYSFEYYWPRGRTVIALSGAGEHRLYMPWLAGRSGGPYRWAEGLYTNGGMEAAEADRRMAEIATGSPVVWLVATEVPLWDERGLVQSWLDAHGRRSSQAQFTRVQVIRYELP